MRPVDDASLRADGTQTPFAVVANVNRQADEPTAGSRMLARQSQMFPNAAAVQSRAALRAERAPSRQPTTSPPDWKDRTCEY